VNCVVSFKPVGCSDAPKGNILTALYCIDVRLNGTTPLLNAINPDKFYRLFSSLSNLSFNFVNAVITSDSDSTFSAYSRKKDKSTSGHILKLFTK